MRRIFGTSAAALALATASPVLAAEGGMPQLNVHDFPPQLVWLAVIFVILYVVMAKVAIPRIGGALDLRAGRIKSDLDRAASLKNQTDQMIVAYEKARAEARNQAAAVARDTASALAQKASERQAQVGAALAAKIKTAEGNIAQARDRAMADIRGVAADIAADAAKRLVGLQVTPADAQQAVAAAMKERG